MSAHRDTVIAAAIQAGKFPESRRNHYEHMWDANPAGTEAHIAKLAAYKPDEHVGAASSSEAYDTSWLHPAERASIEAARRGEAPTVVREA